MGIDDSKTEHAPPTLPLPLVPPYPSHVLIMRSFAHPFLSSALRRHEYIPYKPKPHLVPVVYAHDLISTMHWSRILGPGHASKDHLRDDGSDDKGDDHVEICRDKPDAEPEYYSEHEYYSDDSY